MRRTASGLGLLMAMAVMTACSATTYDVLDVGSVTPVGLSYADADPVDFGAKSPSDYPVHGVDVSKYQGDIDWQQARQAGISFAFVKATEGGDMVDETFAENWRETRAAGIPRSAYHFYYFCRPAIEQAAWYIANVPRDPSALPPVLDMEWNPLSPTCTRRPPPEEVRRQMRIFLGALERHYGKRPIIYTTTEFHEENIDGYFQDYPMWLRATAEHPETLYPGHDWHFWQYTGTGIVPGIDGHADINAFAGSVDSWDRWLAVVAR